MNWAILLVAGLFEIGWAVGLKYTEGFSRLWPSVWTILSMTLSVVPLGAAMKTFTVGTIGTAVSAMVLSGEPANVARLLSLAFIRAGIVGRMLPMSWLSAWGRQRTPEAS